jgi:hypothetical protein
MGRSSIKKSQEYRVQGSQTAILCTDLRAHIEGGAKRTTWGQPNE